MKRLIAGLFLFLLVVTAAACGDDESATSESATPTALSTRETAVLPSPTQAPPTAVPPTQSPAQPAVQAPPQPPAENPNQPRVPPPQSTALPPAMSPPAPVPPIVQQARVHLSQRLMAPVDSLEIVSVERVDWPDSCLGYARPGEVCAQVITPGYKVIFATTQAGPRVTYEYHTDLTSSFRPPP